MLSYASTLSNDDFFSRTRLAIFPGSMDQIVEHFTTDKLVAWSWNPGPGRGAVPMSREEFASKVKEWAAKGAACPAE
jgi:hypothetical protein